MHGRVLRAASLAAGLASLTAGAALGLFPVNAHSVEGDTAPSLRPVVAVTVPHSRSARRGPAIEAQAGAMQKIQIVGSRAFLAGEASAQYNVTRLPSSATSGTFHTGPEADQVTTLAKRDRVGGP
jgi:hypothetical protein